MNVSRLFNCSNLILRSFYSANLLQQSSSLACKLMTLPYEFRQFSSLQNALSSSAFVNFKSFTPLVMPSCGMKTKVHLKLRCRDCYFERRDGEMYVFCNSYGRHRQHLRKKRNKKFNWILSYAFTTKIRPY